MPTNRKVIDFKIHNLTEEQFQELKDAGQIDPNAIYCTPDETVANFEAVNARIDETNKKLNTFESGVNETVGVINTTIVNVDKKVDEAIQTEQQHNIEINARVDETVANFEEINTEIEALKDKGGIPLLSPMWADHALNDMSWLRADTFSWQSGDVYVAAYEHLLSDYNSLPTGVLYAYYAEDMGETFYLYTDTPSLGDQLLDETGTPAYEQYGTHKVNHIYSDGSFAYDTHVPGNRFYRDASKDIALSTPVSATETIDGTTVTYYHTEDGHKICLADQEANVQALYEKTGVAWYYILDTTNKQFKLPRTKFGFTGLRDSVGGYVEAGLPNIYGYMTNILSDGYDNSSKTQALTAKTASTNFYTPQSSGYGLRAESWTFDASHSNSIYGNSDTVQPPATQMYLYFYVGNFEQSATEQTAGLNAELFNGKADRDLKNLPSNYDYIVESQVATANNGYTWFKKYKSGLVIQGGRYTNQSVTGAQATLTATLPIPVTDSNIIASPEYVSGDSIVVVTSWCSGTTANTIVEKNTVSSTLSTMASARWVVFGNAQ